MSNEKPDCSEKAEKKQRYLRILKEQRISLQTREIISFLVLIKSAK